MKNKKNIAVILLCGVALLQFVITIYFNIFEAKNHIGLDSSWDYLKVITVAKNGGIYPIHLISDTTTPLIDRLFIFALPIYMLCGNIYISFALSNLIFTSIILYLMVRIMRAKQYEWLPILVVINLYLCPFLPHGFNWQNDLQYYSCVLGMGGMYSFRIFQMLLAYRIVSADEIKRNEVIAMITLCLCALISGVGSGMSMLVMLYIPLIASRIVIIFLKNDVAEIKRCKSIICFLCFGLVIVGRITGGKLGLQYKDSAESWITANKFWSNLGNQLVGYMTMLGGVSKTSRSPMSKEGFVSILGLIIITVVLISIVFALINAIKAYYQTHNIDDYNTTVLTVILVTGVEFALFDTTYGDSSFEVRYLLLSIISGFLLVGYYINKLNEELLFKRTGIIVLSVAILGMNLVSDYLYKRDSNDAFQISAMVDLINSKDAGLVYAWGDNTGIYERCLRVYDPDRVYKYITSKNKVNSWGDYLYYADSTEYEGATILMVDEGEKIVPDSIMKNYEYLDTIHSIEFYYSKDNFIDIKAL